MKIVHMGILEKHLGYTFCQIIKNHVLLKFNFFLNSYIYRNNVLHMVCFFNS